MAPDHALTPTLALCFLCAQGVVEFVRNAVRLLYLMGYFPSSVTVQAYKQDDPACKFELLQTRGSAERRPELM